MNKRSIRILEYEKILEQLQGYAVTQGAKRKIQNMKPRTDKMQIEGLQQNTRDAFLRLEQYGQVSFSGVHDIRESLRLLEIDSALTADELLDIASLLETAAEVKSYGDVERSGEKYYDSLTPYFDILMPLRDISSEIRRCIIASDEIADDASSALRSIRRKITSSEAELHNTLNKIIHNASNRDMLMDALVTTRNGRYCIPVKIEYKNAFPGMVHDRSSTGSTIFIEPMQVVELNNTIQELHTDEKLEIEKILSDLSQLAGSAREDILEDYKALVDLDFCFAKAKYAKATNASEPVYSTDENDRSIELKRAIHPLLDPATAVPIDLRLGDNYNLLIITGPNTGGKTVSLKTLGLLVLMAQSGLHIPAAEGSKLAIFEDVFADIGDEQSIELSLSTFSSHMSNIIYIVKHANDRSLVLFDEPGGGTDPAEGASLAIAILESLKNKGALVMATTHYTELKTYAITADRVENASCEFDMNFLRPTYKLMIGIPGSSNAFAIASRLGMPDEITKAAREGMDEAQVNMERVIAQLEESEREMSRLREELEIETNSAKQLRVRLEDKEKNLDEKRSELIEKAKNEARDIVDEAKSFADNAIRDYNKWLRDPNNANTSIMEEKRAALREKRDGYTSDRKKSDKPEAKISNQKASDFKLGDKVLVLSLNIEGHVVEKPDAKDMVLVEMGILTSRYHISDLLIIDEDKIRTKDAASKFRSAGTSAGSSAMYFKPEINVMGKTVDEALQDLDKYLDSALLSHVDQVTIIHGKGTGALRRGITEYLKKKKFVKSFRSGEFGEGDAGVTIVKL